MEKRIGYIPPVKMIPVGMGVQFDECLKKSDLNMSQVSKVINVSRKTLYRIYEGNNTSLIPVLKLCDLFNCSLHWFVYGYEYGRK